MIKNGKIAMLALACIAGVVGLGAPAFAAGLHVAAASPAGFIVEYSLGANPLLHDLVEEDFLVKDGMIEVPERPGLGVTVREDFLKQHTVAA